jgi:hypothetical protein
MIKPRKIRLKGHVALILKDECIEDSGGNPRRKETTRKT